MEGLNGLAAARYTNSEDIRPQSTGFATEIEGTTPVNRANASENCETSSIGRALANLGFATKGKRPSREEMEKVENLQGQAVDYYQPKNVRSAAESISPKCEHGHRLKRMGTSEKTGKPIWAGLAQRRPELSNARLSGGSRHLTALIGYRLKTIRII
jgi:hypothetical protein